MIHYKLITGLLPKGYALPVLTAMKDAPGVIAANINNARGTGRITPLAHRGIGEQSEKEILSVVVEAERAEEIFEQIFFDAQVDRPHGGILFMSALGRSTRFELPDLPEEA